ncbi:S-layer homology domain-containing protein [Magnetococcales bacterium HHB-1]
MKIIKEPFWLFERLNIISVCILCAAVSLISGCATPEKAGESALDNWKHHYMQGMRALENNSIKEASSAFDRALELKPDYALAVAGQTLALAYETEQLKDEGFKKVNFKRIEEGLDKAQSLADTSTARFSVLTSAIRTLTKSRLEDWFLEAKSKYQEAKALTDLDEKDLPYYRALEAIDFFMAEAWYGEDFRQSEQLLKNVLNARAGGVWQSHADKLYRKIQQVTRVASNRSLSGAAAKVAVQEQIGRGDLAALLVDELQLEKRFTNPLKGKQSKKPTFIPADMLKHPLKKSVRSVLSWNIRGLSAEYDKASQAKLFKPEKVVDRKSLALVLEDIIIKITGKEAIATALIGQETGITDVKSHHGWSNAVRTVVNRGLMKNNLSGAFRPHDPVTGAEALSALFRLRNALETM